MKGLFLTVSILTSLSAFANIKEDGSLYTYNLGDCKVEVSQSSVTNGIEVELRPKTLSQYGAQYGNIIIAQDTNKIRKINICNDMWASEAEEISSTVTSAQGKTTYQATCGGSFSRVEAVVLAEFDDKSGLLTQFSLKEKIAYGLPNGLHSGPIKTIAENFSCR